ncbi:MAG: aspartate aminotransferase family protein [Chloroflexi bacterium]|nr:aspartate aminotransferase family protein [Chloroflexota bacterium]
MALKHEKSNALWQKAKEVIPLGVSSSFRFHGPKNTYYVARAKGAYYWDVDGNRYIDYSLAWGPVILGHAYDEVDNYVHEQIKLRGTTTALTTDLEIEVAEKFVAMCPCVEKVRLVNSGTEATMHSLRLARGYTGRDKYIKFEGAYHGVHDYVLYSMYANPMPVYGSRRSPIPVPESSGIPKVINDTVITVPYNDCEALDLALKRSGHEVAAILVEPVLGNCVAIGPEPGFLQFLRQKCDEYGIVLIFDEVKTGFHLAVGGAQEYYGVTPDLATYAKAIGNGYPAAAFGGKKELMDMIAVGQVEIDGTYCGNVVSVAAMNATLGIIQREPVLETIFKRGRRLQEGLRSIFEENGIPAFVTEHPAMFGIILAEKMPRDQREWELTDKATYQKIVLAAHERGISKHEVIREPYFLSYSHSEADIDETLNVMADVVHEVKLGRI